LILESAFHGAYANQPGGMRGNHLRFISGDLSLQYHFRTLFVSLDVIGGAVNCDAQTRKQPGEYFKIPPTNFRLWNHYQVRVTSAPLTVSYIITFSGSTKSEVAAGDLA
jgi:hypothetical protein